MFTNFKTIFFIPTEKELKKIFGKYEIKSKDNFKYAYCNDIPIIITGIGKANAAITATFFFSHYKPKSAVLMGICGAYRSSGIKIGETVSIVKEYFADECSYDGKNITSLKEKGMAVYGGEDFISLKEINSFRTATSNTVSFIPAEDKLSEIYRLKTGADTENMEGAAFALAALKNGFSNIYELRTISNYCGSNPEWNINIAAENMRKAVEKVIRNLN